MYPLVRELAVDGILVTVSCRVLNLARQPYYRWLQNPLSDRQLEAGYVTNAVFDAHRSDPELQNQAVNNDEATFRDLVFPERFQTGSTPADHSKINGPWSRVVGMRQMAACLVLAVAVTGCGGSSGGANGWPEETSAAFSNACVLNAEESGADPDSAQDYCSCALTELERRYSATEFAEIEQKMMRGEATDLDMTDLAEICLS
jgi:hypothetical protein